MLFTISDHNGVAFPFPYAAAPTAAFKMNRRISPFWQAKFSLGGGGVQLCNTYVDAPKVHIADTPRRVINWLPRLNPPTAPFWSEWMAQTQCSLFYIHLNWRLGLSIFLSVSPSILSFSVSLGVLTVGESFLCWPPADHGAEGGGGSPIPDLHILLGPGLPCPLQPRWPWTTCFFEPEPTASWTSGTPDQVNLGSRGFLTEWALDFANLGPRAH